MSGEALAQPFPGCVDLAGERVGGRVLAANDEFFAPKENLLKPEPAVFIPGKFTSRGKWMDGWETRRRRTPGHDWCVIRLGVPGTLRGVDIDTSHFLGNHPPFASIEACRSGGRFDPAAAPWTTVLEKAKLKPGSHNLFGLSGGPFTHLRLNIYPDGGVARLRVYGEAAPDLKPGRVVDLASILNGGCVLAANDMFFGPKDNLILPDRPRNMGDGWETRRKRGPGHDWVVLRLGAPGRLRRILIDTTHFKGNYPDRASVEGLLSRDRALDPARIERLPWRPVLPPVKLKPHARHSFAREILSGGPFSHLRLRIYPDGGVSRLRAYGAPEPGALRGGR